LHIGEAAVIVQMAALLAMHSFLQYWVHRAGHQIPILWALHRIHHSDTTLDATTALRHHPLESIIDYAAIAVPILVFAPSAQGLLAYMLFLIGFSFFVHMDPALLPERLDRALARVVMTPRLHRLHHSTYQPETDTNYTNVLVIWDRLFGTFLAPTPHPRAGFRLGLDAVSPKAARDPFLQMAEPFLRADSPDHKT
jgi:sterol desaturase/sphingolipid hydroxylase (fatty acid hydroxylase superfamily)